MNNIYARVLADSISKYGHRLTTFEVQFPKVLGAEFNTHRMLSRNFSSSRAIPNSRFTDVESFEPQYYGSNQPGMQASELIITEEEKAHRIWEKLIRYSKTGSKMLDDLHLHKQWSNRPNDWHIMCKGIVSATEWTNFLWLRYHEAAQPEFAELARIISYQLDASEPGLLAPGEWHLPYIKSVRSITDSKLMYYDSETGQELSLDIAQKVSSSCCAQVSYRKLDESVGKSLEIYERLVGSDRLHASAFEHVGTPIDLDCNLPFQPNTWDPGITHVRRNGSLWSGNFNGFIQYRQLIPGESKQ